MVGRALSEHNQIPYPPDGQPTNWKIIISQRSSHKSESPEPLSEVSETSGTTLNAPTFAT